MGARPPPPEPAHIFVYGTLRPAYARMAGSSATMNPPTLLHDLCRHVGEATLHGYALVHLGAYPAIIPAPPPARVIGDVYALPSPPPAGAMATLDAYEGIGDEFPPPQEYRRVAATVVLARSEKGGGGGDGGGGGGDRTTDTRPGGEGGGGGDRTLPAWIYVYLWATDGGTVIDGGDWLGWIAARAAAGGGPEPGPRSAVGVPAADDSKKGV